MERQLIQYLPAIVREYDVFQALTGGEQPEFELAWDAQELAFADQFIDTAGNYGLSRWETILHMTPAATDTVESRRVKIKAKINTMIPYTIRGLIQMINAIADGEPYTVTLEEGTYRLEIKTQWEANGKVDSLKDILEHAIPANIKINSKNRIDCAVDSPHRVAAPVILTELIYISD